MDGCKLNLSRSAKKGRCPTSADAKASVWRKAEDVALECGRGAAGRVVIERGEESAQNSRIVGGLEFA